MYDNDELCVACANYWIHLSHVILKADVLIFLFDVVYKHKIDFNSF